MRDAPPPRGTKSIPSPPVPCPLPILGSKAAFCRLVVPWHPLPPPRAPLRGPDLSPVARGAAWQEPGGAVAGSRVFTGGAAGCCTTGSRVREDTLSSSPAVGAAAPAAGTDGGAKGTWGDAGGELRGGGAGRQDHPLGVGMLEPGGAKQPASCFLREIPLQMFLPVRPRVGYWVSSWSLAGGKRPDPALGDPSSGCDPLLFARTHGSCHKFLPAEGPRHPRDAGGPPEQPLLHRRPDPVPSPSVARSGPFPTHFQSINFRVAIRTPALVAKKPHASRRGYLQPEALPGLDRSPSPRLPPDTRDGFYCSKGHKYFPRLFPPWGKEGKSLHPLTGDELGGGGGGAGRVQRSPSPTGDPAPHKRGQDAAGPERGG